MSQLVPKSFDSFDKFTYNKTPRGSNVRSNTPVSAAAPPPPPTLTLPPVAVPPVTTSEVHAFDPSDILPALLTVPHQM